MATEVLVAEVVLAEVVAPVAEAVLVVEAMAAGKPRELYNPLKR